MQQSLYRAAIFVIVLINTFIVFMVRCPQNAASKWHETTVNDGCLMRYRMEGDQTIETYYFDRERRMIQHSYYDWRYSLHIVLYDPATGQELSHEIR